MSMLNIVYVFLRTRLQTECGWRDGVGERGWGEREKHFFYQLGVRIVCAVELIECEEWSIYMNIF